MRAKREQKSGRIAPYIPHRLQGDLATRRPASVRREPHRTLTETVASCKQPYVTQKSHAVKLKLKWRNARRLP